MSIQDNEKNRRIAETISALMDPITECLKFYAKHAPDCSGAEIACSCGLSQLRHKAFAEIADLKAQIASAENEKRLWLCKELGIEPSHSWRNIVEEWGSAIERIADLESDVTALRTQITEHVNLALIQRKLVQELEAQLASAEVKGRIDQIHRVERFLVDRPTFDELHRWISREDAELEKQKAQGKA